MEGDYPWGPGFARHEVLVDLHDRARDPVNHPRKIVPAGKGNLYQSTLKGPGNKGLHAPTLDIDLPCYLIQSTTPGHCHLYIDRKMSWDKYSELLVVMGHVGILQPGYVDLSLKRGATHLRKPDVHKGPDDYPDS